MHLLPELLPAYTEGIGAALRDTGYEPFRVDRLEHNNKIDDVIISEIRRSGLLIADVTNHRPSVYFEAGFAMGLGLPVIWSVKQDQIDAVHFDTRQYSHVVWSDPEDLRKKLVTRLRATVPVSGSKP